MSDYILDDCCGRKIHPEEEPHRKGCEYDALSRAIKRYGAVEVSSGTYAFKPENHSRWYCVSAADLAVRSQGRRQLSQVTMPYGWTPKEPPKDCTDCGATLTKGELQDDQQTQPPRCGRCLCKLYE